MGHNRDRKTSDPRRVLAVGYMAVLLKEGQSIDALSSRVLFFVSSTLIFNLKY